jgi:ABC-type anion transport system duplicated permease subunit
VAPALGTTIRLTLLILVTAIAGYVPAKIIVRKNTLDSILGRK